MPEQRQEARSAATKLDGYELRRMDALGELEAEMDGEPKTFEQFVTEQPNVLGVIHAEVPDAD